MKQQQRGIFAVAGLAVKDVYVIYSYGPVENLSGHNVFLL
jgi:hypothetical protein